MKLQTVSDHYMKLYTFISAVVTSPSRNLVDEDATAITWTCMTFGQVNISTGVGPKRHYCTPISKDLLDRQLYYWALQDIFALILVKIESKSESGVISFPKIINFITKIKRNKRYNICLWLPLKLTTAMICLFLPCK